MIKEHCKSCGKHRNELEETPWGTRIEGTLDWGIICKPCRAREIENKIEVFQSKNIDTTYENNIICPYCGHEHESDGESGAFYTDGAHHFDCGECNNTFIVETTISFSYSTYKEL